MKQIYLLEKHKPETGEATTDFLHDEPFNVGECPRCAVCGTPVGMLSWEPPLRAEIETWGAKFGDMAFGPGDSFLVSERFKVLWEQEGLAGLHGFESVQVVKVRPRGKRIKEAPPRYFHVWPSRSEVAVDQERMGVQWTRAPSCDVCKEGVMKGYERIVLEGEPEENVFTPRGLGVLLVDECFKRFFEEHAISNCPLIPAEQASYWPLSHLP